jgi:hypothetical protein
MESASAKVNIKMKINYFCKCFLLLVFFTLSYPLQAEGSDNKNSTITGISELKTRIQKLKNTRPETKQKKPVIMVSSTVYGIEEMLDDIYELLSSYGYEVWMSHKGTIPLRSDKTAFENCIWAVENCDIFLGLITTSYGSGLDSNNPDAVSITHQEALEAIKSNKPRWFLAHEQVLFARTLLANLGYRSKSERRKLTLKRNPIFSDLRIIDLYEDATIDQEPPNAVALAERKGNWVQKYRSPEEVLLFIKAQFSNYNEIKRFIEKNNK